MNNKDRYRKFYIVVEKKDEFIKTGILTYDRVNFEFTIDILPPKNKEELGVYPAALHIAYMKGMEHLNSQISNIFIKERFFPAERYGAQQLLKALELKYYDEMDILDKTHGVSINDNAFLVEIVEDKSFEESVNEIIEEVRSYLQQANPGLY